MTKNRRKKAGAEACLRRGSNSGPAAYDPTAPLTALSTLAVATTNRRHDKATRPQQGRRISLINWKAGIVASVSFSVTALANVGQKTCENILRVGKR